MPLELPHVHNIWVHSWAHSCEKAPKNDEVPVIWWSIFLLGVHPCVSKEAKANSQCALITSLPMGRFYLKFLNCIPVFLNCISPMYFSTVILYCISLPYFSTVFCHCPKQILSVLLSPVCEWTDRVTKWEISHTEKTSQELRMLSNVTLNCQVAKIVMNSGSQLSVL